MSRMGGKRADGWYEMERQYRRNKVPQPPPVTRWESVIADLKTTEDKALKAIKHPCTPEEKKLRSELQKRVRGMRDRRYIPSVALDAFGWREQQEQKFSC